MATMPKTSPRIKPIEVFATGKAKKDPEYLSKSNHEEAEFFCLDTDVNVVFDSDEGSPFDTVCFHVYKGNQGVRSGPLKDKGVPIGGHYHYHVRPMKGTGMGADPEIIVN